MAAFSKGEAVAYGWMVMKEHFWLFIGVLAITLGFTILTGLTGQHLENTPGVWLINIILQLVGIWINIGVIRICLKLYDDGAAGLNEIFSGGRYFLTYLGTSLLAGLLGFLGFILLVIPGIYIGLRLQFASYLVIDQGLGVTAAIKQSWVITEGSAWNLFLLSLLLALINIAGLLCLVVGLLATIPTSLMAVVFVYKKLSEQISNSFDTTHVPPSFE